MNFVFLIAGLVCLVFFIFFLIKIIQNSKNRDTKKAVLWMFWLIAIYLLFSLLFLLWFFEILSYSLEDFRLILSVSLVFQTLVLLNVGNQIRRTRHFWLILGGYFVILALIVFDFLFFVKYSAFISYIFMGFFFLHLLFLSESYKRMGGLGIFYIVISVVLNLLLIQGWGNYILFFIISLAFLAVFLFFFLKDVGLFFSNGIHHPESNYMSFLGHLFFVILIINLLFVGTIALHEFGHYSVSKLYNCEYRQIVYSGESFYTDIFCENIDDNLWIILGGILLPYIVAVILFLVPGRFLFDLGLLIAGFNSISVSRDFREMGLSFNLVFVSIFAGIVLTVYGISKIIKSRIDLESYHLIDGEM